MHSVKKQTLSTAYAIATTTIITTTIMRITELQRSKQRELNMNVFN